MFLFKNIVQSEPENYSLEKTAEIMTLNSLINMGHSSCAVQTDPINLKSDLKKNTVVKLMI